MMTLFILFLLCCQALGAFTGALSAVWGELLYIRALRDGKIDSAERAHLRSIARGLRLGMLLLLLSSFGLVVVAYALNTAPQPALSASYWTLIALAVLVISISWALSQKRVSFAFGSAAIFTGWWFLAFFTLGQIPSLSFGAAVAFFVVAVAIFYALLQYSRFLSLRK